MRLKWMETCWSLEERITEKQGMPFRLHAPDEAEARAAFADRNPGRVRARNSREGAHAGTGLFGGRR